MGFGGFLKDGLQLGFDWTSGGLTRIAGEDTLAKIPVLNSITGSQPDSAKALIKKQEELAKDAELQKKKNQQMRMQALGQSMLAFNPQNQMMAQMYGPQAAFSPQQMAQMSADPGAMSQADYDRAYQESARTGKPMGVTADDKKRMQENQRRMAQVQSQTTPLGPGPAPLKLPPPAAARRY
jgi:hypothetical protein